MCLKDEHFKVLIYDRHFRSLLCQQTAPFLTSSENEMKFAIDGGGGVVLKNRGSNFNGGMMMRAIRYDMAIPELT